MSSRLLLFIVPVVFLFTACKPSHDKALAKVVEAEDALKKSYASGKPETQMVLGAVDAYEQFVKYYPKDSMAPVFLIKAGDCYRILKQYDKAIAEYQKVENNYQGSKAYPNSIFIQGFVYENEVKDLPKAKERYETFLKKFPDNEMARAAQFSVPGTLGVVASRSW